jgi:hypothetical protein
MTTGPGADRGRVDVVRPQRGRARDLGRRRGRATSYTCDDADRLSTLANPVTGTTATYSYNSDSPVTGISYGAGKRLPVVRVRQPAPADLRHPRVLLRRHSRVPPLPARRRQRDHPRGNHRPGRGRVEHVHLHLRRGGPAHLLRQPHDHHRVQLRQQREPDRARVEDLHRRRKRPADQRWHQQLHLHGPRHPVIGAGHGRALAGDVRRLRRPGQRRDPVARLRRAGPADRRCALGRRHRRRGRRHPTPLGIRRYLTGLLGRPAEQPRPGARLA